MDMEAAELVVAKAKENRKGAESTRP